MDRWRNTRVRIERKEEMSRGNRQTDGGWEGKDHNGATAETEMVERQTKCE